MIVQFSNIDMNDRPILILKQANGTPIGVLGNATNVEFEPKYNEVSVLTFMLPASVDGVATPFYNEVTGQKIIELKGIGQFIVTDPKETGDKITRKLQVTANSLEREFSRKKLSLPESTYRFFDSTNPDGTILGMIMELMPNWGVGSVSSSLYSKYRTFDVSNENLYNLIKGSIQKAYNCIFDFDTLNRLVHVRDADATPAQRQVYISRDNLAKDITVTENPDDMVTRLSVSGAEGVDIRDVNPTGSNSLINLDYFVETGDFPQAIASRYTAWKTLVDNNRTAFYNDAVRYAMLLSEETAEYAKLADLRGQRTSLENIQAVIIQGIARHLRTQADLNAANANLAAKEAEIQSKEAEIAAIRADRDDAMAAMQAIRDACAFDAYFTAEERRILDPYIIDNSIEETSFVASEVQSYTDGAGNTLQNTSISITGADVTTTTSSSGAVLRSVTGGTLTVPNLVAGNIIRAEIEQRTGNRIVASVYMGAGTYNGAAFPSACVSLSGSGSVSGSDTSATISVTDGTIYFSLNASDYERKTVAWDLYEYGEAMLRKMSVPSYSFSVDSANFIALEQFLLFKNELELGQRVYIEVSDGKILKPICTGAKVKWSDRAYLELKFNDTFTANDGEAKLVELLDNSISMGKTLSAGKFTYEAWTGSGASTALHDFITSALDTSKNAILSSTEQAVSWDGAGLRLRRWTSDAHTAYENEQIWMSNNSIMMTDDNWATAKMAIGKFSDANLGEKWGIVAPMVVGTLLAGEELVIESEKKDGGTAVFRVDEDGASLFNAHFTIQKTNSNNTTTQILLNPDHGIVIGTYPVIGQNDAIDPDNAKFWADANGNLNLTGTIFASAGEIGGWYIGEDYIGNADTKAGSTVGLDADASEDTVSFWAGGSQDDALFTVTAGGLLTAQNADITGRVSATELYINDNGTETAIENYLANQGYRLQADHEAFMSEYWDTMFGDDGIMTHKTQYLQNDGTISLSAFTEGNNGTAMGLVKKAGISVDANGKIELSSLDSGVVSNTALNTTLANYATISMVPTNISALTWDSLGNASKILMTPTSVKITTGGTFELTSTYTSITTTGYLTTTGGKIANWTIEANRLSSGSGSGYVGLDSNNTLTNPNAAWNVSTNDWVQPYAIWCGNGTPGSAPFRVRRDGTVYINSLRVWDGSTWQTIDFSGNFNNAVTYASGRWDGNNFIATLSLWGKVSKTISLTGSFSIASASVNPISALFAGDQGYGAISVNYYLDGKLKSSEFTNVNVNISDVTASVWSLAAGKVSYTPGAKTVTVPDTARNTDKPLDISETWNAGERAGKADGVASVGVTSSWGEGDASNTVTVTPKENSHEDSAVFIITVDSDSDTIKPGGSTKVYAKANAASKAEKTITATTGGLSISAAGSGGNGSVWLNPDGTMTTATGGITPSSTVELDPGGEQVVKATLNSIEMASVTIKAKTVTPRTVTGLTKITLTAGENGNDVSKTTDATFTSGNGQTGIAIKVDAHKVYEAGAASVTPTISYRTVSTLAQVVLGASETGTSTQKTTATFSAGSAQSDISIAVNASLATAAEYKRGWNECRAEVLKTERTVNEMTTGVKHSHALWDAPAPGAQSFSSCYSSVTIDPKTKSYTIPAEKK